MKTAEEIIEEYRSRGYSPESLRILAESRGGSLGSRMLEILDALAVDDREPETVPAEPLFFVADDEEAVDAEAEVAVDFDVMAETLEPPAEAVAEETAEEMPEIEEAAAVAEEPAATEESVADILVDDYMPGSVAVDFEPEPEAVAEETAVEETIIEAPAEESPAALISRKEQRRLARLEKKKARRAQKADAVSILTPLDLVAPAEEVNEEPAIAPELLALVSAHGYTLTASLAAMAQTELAKAAESIEADRAAALAVEQNNEINNIILFSDQYLTFAETADETEESEDPEEEDSEDFTPVLRVLPAPEADTAYEDAVQSCDVNENAVEHLLAEPEPEAAVAEEEEQDSAVEEIFEELAAAITEEPVAEEIAEEPAAEETAEDVSEEPAAPEEPAVNPLAALLEHETALRAQLEEEYQERLDAFAARLLDAQEIIAASETRAAETKNELDARCAILETMKTRLAENEEKQKELLEKLDAASAAVTEAASAKDAEAAAAAARFADLRTEHNRLFSEFEDLRKTYNEVITDVMPALQSERDDLAMTVERQCEKTQKLRLSLNASRKRLAAGYILGAAACLMLVALPVANWLRSGDGDKQLAVDHQLFSELRETLNTQVQQNVDAQTRIVELERKITRARDEISRLDGQNRELASIAGTAAGASRQHAEGIAVFEPAAASNGGTPTRAVTMALQATTPADGRLRVNEVMDPAGSIEQLALANREKNAVREDGAQMAARARTQPLQVSAVARTERPTAAAKATVRMESKKSTEVADAGTVTAKVKKGEGVAQVVYRVLNTRDPEVIAWVIRENNIKTDRRKNPVIQPNQELRLPRNGNTGQSASAAR